MRLAVTINGRIKCCVCAWEAVAADNNAAEKLVRSHLRDYHTRWMVSRCDSSRKGIETATYTGPRWSDVPLGMKP